MTDLTNALVLVTGAAGGFGRHFVAQLLDLRSRVIVTDVDATALEDMLTHLGDRRQRIEDAVVCDLSVADGPRQLQAALQLRHLSPEVVINNAGVGVAGRIDLVPEERWEALMQVNLLAPMRLTALFLPDMIERRAGHIVNVSSLAGWVGSPFISSYCATKFGLRGFSEGLALDLADHGIRVSTIYPSFSDTPIIQSDQFGFGSPRVVPPEILTRPEDVVRRSLRGVRHDRRNIFPDTTSKITHYLARYVPGAVSVLQKRLERRTRQAAQP
ncbi:MAG: SDR family NAD(P)-dependent oxidoreductase [Pseudomonadota bacterium]